MKLTDCIDWQQATVTAIRRYDEVSKAVYVLSDQIKRRQEKAQSPNLSNASVVPAKGGANKVEDRWIAAIEDTKILRENLLECRSFLKQFDYAWQQLTPMQQRLLQVKYRSNMSATQAIVSLMDEFGYEKTRLYDLVKDALKSLSHILYGA